MKLVIVGGGGFRVPLVYRALAQGRFAGLIDSLVLVDTDAGRAEAIRRVLGDMPLSGEAGRPDGLPPGAGSGADGGSAPQVDPDSGHRPAVEVQPDLRTALAGADVVFAAVRSGGPECRVLDERVALKAGLLGQETVGAGGISYALRSIPDMMQVARLMQEHAPDAWLVNFTNPAGMVTEALRTVLGERVIGICDSASGLVARASAAAGIPLPLGSLAGVDYVGLNHLGWLRGLMHDGEDRLPALLRDPARLLSFEEGRVFGPDLPRLLGTLPNEYLFYYYFHREALRAVSSAGQTRGEVLASQQHGLYPRLLEASRPFAVWEEARLARESGYLVEARHPDEQRELSDLAGGGYERVALQVMHALLTDTPAELILNVRNGTTFPGLPEDAVVEVPARVSGSGAVPLSAAPLTVSQLGLMASVKAAEQQAVQAALYADRAAALSALTLHPLVDSAHAAARVLAGYEEAFPGLERFWRV
ncbi:family 4 glycosyl hydrolase [Arthrobacter sp. H41]|uniref:family 4 glycosyl hydrolase n=1 Tax=Arthrobacter sp. H41 TaxID=1312978 RepID=UPI000479F7B0|nr:6-phospho-beta-glucosidase [Arthrobacter sp. H41]